MMDRAHKLRRSRCRQSGFQFRDHLLQLQNNCLGTLKPGTLEGSISTLCTYQKQGAYTFALEGVDAAERFSQEFLGKLSRACTGISVGANFWPQAPLDTLILGDIPIGLLAVL